jgi:hypothetical protein
MGMVEALKAKNPIYRWMLGYFLWMGRLSSRARWGVILGGWLGARMLGEFADSNERLQPWIAPILLTYVGFVLLTWFSVPLFNLLLRLHPLGRHALSRDQRISSNWFGLCLLAFLAAAATYLATDSAAAMATALVAVGLALPLVTIYYLDSGWPRQAMTLFAAAMAVVGGIVIAGAVLDVQWGIPFVTVFLFGFIGTPWLANYLSTVTVRR